MRLLALTCEVLARPVYWCAARSPHTVDVRLERRGLHDEPRALGDLLQAEIDAADDRFDAVVLAYGLCGGGTAGLRAAARPLVVPRAHDCITLLLGDRARYDAEMAAAPGTYWYTEDFVERTDIDGRFAGLGAVSDAEARALHAAYVERYGRDNADYLMEVLGAWRDHYTRAALIDLGEGTHGGTGAAERAAMRDATRHGWVFERLAGRLLLVRRLLEGDWDPADFLVLEPGQRLAMSHDAGIIRAEPAGPA